MLISCSLDSIHKSNSSVKFKYHPNLSLCSPNLLPKLAVKHHRPYLVQSASCPRYNNRNRFNFDFEDAEVFLLCYFKTLRMAALEPEQEKNLFEWTFAIHNIKFSFLAQLNFINARDVCMYFPSLILQLCWLLFFRFDWEEKGRIKDEGKACPSNGGPGEGNFLRIKERTRKLMSERVYKFEKLNSI